MRASVPRVRHPTVRVGGASLLPTRARKTTETQTSYRYPAEALTRVQALRGMTRDVAYAAFAEHTRGQLAPGFAADFVVLDRDIMQVPLEEILGTRVLATVVDGQVAYGSI